MTLEDWCSAFIIIAGFCGAFSVILLDTLEDP